MNHAVAETSLMRGQAEVMIRGGNCEYTATLHMAGTEHRQYLHYMDESKTATSVVEVMRGNIEGLMLARDTMASSSAAQPPAPTRPWSNDEQ